MNLHLFSYILPNPAEDMECIEYFCSDQRSTTETNLTIVPNYQALTHIFGWPQSIQTGFPWLKLNEQMLFSH